MSTIEVKKNNSITNDPCALCGTRCDPEGVDPFIAGTWKMVCDQCAEPEATDLLSVSASPARPLPSGPHDRREHKCQAPPAPAATDAAP